MATPAIHLHRLPSDAEATRILNDAIGKGPDSKEVKERRNLCRALDWAYKGLAPADKALAVHQYAGNLTADLAAAMQKPDSRPDAIILALLRALIAGKAALQHPGGARLAVMTPAQDTALRIALFAFESHLREMARGTYDPLIYQVFPAEAGDSVWGIVGKSNAHVVKETFANALAAAKRLLAAGNIRVDSYSPVIFAGGLTNPDQMAFPVSFFVKTPNEMEATLAHESTHAIANSSRTNDEGGYIGSQKFEIATFAERRMNASHFEAVIRLINHEVLPPAQPGAVLDVKGQAKEIVRRAWDKGLNLYLNLHTYQTTPAHLAHPPDAQHAKQISQLFGLGLHKQPAIHAIADSDLAAAENRVGKLGVLLGAVDTASASVAANDPPMTVDKILAKLVEMEGALRKTTDNAKTVAMIKTLANMNPATVAKFVAKDYS